MGESSWDKRLASWFRERRWRVLSELTGAVDAGDGRIVYASGVFDIDPPGVFISSFGVRARHGAIAIEVDSDGHDIPGTDTAFSEAVLRRARETYGTVAGLPAED